MQVNLFNAKNPNGILIPVTVTVEQMDIVNTDDGEVVYTIVLTANALDLNNARIDDVIINNVTKENLKSEIESGLTIIASKINWGILEEDIYAPIITSLTPSNREENVNIFSNVVLNIRDPFPASFINPASIKLYVNGIDETSKLNIKLKDNEVKITYIPVRIL